MEFKTYEPACDRKSWYGKCSVYEQENGAKALRSYSTIVMTVDEDGNKHRHWGGWSATTARHIWRAFGVDTKTYRNMEVERLPLIWQQLQHEIKFNELRRQI